MMAPISIWSCSLISRTGPMHRIHAMGQLAARVLEKRCRHLADCDLLSPVSKDLPGSDQSRSASPQQREPRIELWVLGLG